MRERSRDGRLTATLAQEQEREGGDGRITAYRGVRLSVCVREETSELTQDAQ